MQRRSVGRQEDPTNDDQPEPLLGGDGPVHAIAVRHRTQVAPCPHLQWWHDERLVPVTTFLALTCPSRARATRSRPPPLPRSAGYDDTEAGSRGVSRRCAR